VIGAVGTLRPSDAFVPHVHLCRSAIVVVVVVVVVAVVDSGTQKRAAFSMTTADERKTREQNGRQKKVSCFVVFTTVFYHAAVFISLKTNKPVATLHAADVNAFAFLNLYLSIFLSIHLSCARPILS